MKQSQGDMFDQDAYGGLRAHRIEPEVHNPAHDTEIEWKRKMRQRWQLEGLAKRVYDLALSPEGVTGWEAAKLTGNRAVEWSVRPILSRLKKEGLVRVSKWRRRNGRGAREIVYVATAVYDPAQHEDPDSGPEHRRDDL